MQGASPSKKLVDAAAVGDVEGLQAALDAGGDVNAPLGQRHGTALHAAARVGYVRATHALLAAGARDVRDSRGRTALHVAAKHGQGQIVGILLDRGSDHFAVDHLGLRAIDWAARRRHVNLLRLMETRVCPFFGPLLIEIADWRGRPRLKEVWVAVHRARPWDNPAVSRDSVTLCIYESRAEPLPEAVLDRPELRPLATDTEGDVIFELVSAAGRRKSARSAPKPTVVQARAPRVLFTWLANVLSSSFASGRGPGFDDTGDVAMPAPARAMAALFSTAEITKAPDLAFVTMALARATNPAEAIGGTAACGWQRMSPGIALELRRAATAASAAVPHDEGVSDPVAVATPAAVAVQAGGTGLAQPQLPGTERTRGIAPNATYATMPLYLPPSAPPSSASASPHSIVPNANARRATSTSTATSRPLQPVVPIDTATASRSRRATALPPTAGAVTGSVSTTATSRRLVPGAPLPDTIEFDAEPPEDLLCPVTLQLMTDPVVCIGDGHTYSRDGIATWLRSHRTSPKTNAVMSDTRLVTTHLLRGQVLSWIDAHRIDHLAPLEREQRRSAGAAAAAAARATAREKESGEQGEGSTSARMAPRSGTDSRRVPLASSPSSLSPQQQRLQQSRTVSSPGRNSPTVGASARLGSLRGTPPPPVAALHSRSQNSASNSASPLAMAAAAEAEESVDPQPDFAIPSAPPPQLQAEIGVLHDRLPGMPARASETADASAAVAASGVHVVEATTATSGIISLTPERAGVTVGDMVEPGTESRSRAPLPFRPLVFFRSSSSRSNHVTSTPPVEPMDVDPGAQDLPAPVVISEIDAPPVHPAANTIATTPDAVAVSNTSGVDAFGIFASAEPLPEVPAPGTMDAANGAVIEGEDATSGNAPEATSESEVPAAATVVIGGVEFRFPVPPTHTYNSSSLHSIRDAEALLDLSRAMEHVEPGAQAHERPEPSADQQVEPGAHAHERPGPGADEHTIVPEPAAGVAVDREIGGAVEALHREWRAEDFPSPPTYIPAPLQPLSVNAEDDVRVALPIAIAIPSGL